MIRAVCFDFDGTLAEFTGEFDLLLDRLQTELTLADCDGDTFRTTLSREIRRDGAVTLESALSATLEQLRLPPPADLDRGVHEAQHRYARGMKLLPGAIGALDACRTHALPSALLTNGPYDLQRAAIEALGIEGHFRTVLISGDPDVAAKKPHARMFSLACTALESLPEQTLMVGDTAHTDLQGALDYGMEALLVGGEPEGGYDVLPSLDQFPAWLVKRLDR